MREGERERGRGRDRAKGVEEKGRGPRNHLILFLFHALFLLPLSFLSFPLSLPSPSFSPLSLSLLFSFHQEYKGAIISALPHLISIQQIWGAPGTREGRERREGGREEREEHERGVRGERGVREGERGERGREGGGRKSERGMRSGI